MLVLGVALGVLDKSEIGQYDGPTDRPDAAKQRDVHHICAFCLVPCALCLLPGACCLLPCALCLVLCAFCLEPCDVMSKGHRFSNCSTSKRFGSFGTISLQDFHNSEFNGPCGRAENPPVPDMAFMSKLPPELVSVRMSKKTQILFNLQRVRFKRPRACSARIKHPKHLKHLWHLEHLWHLKHLKHLKS